MNTTQKSNSSAPIDLSQSFKAYDVRGVVGDTITNDSVYATGAAFVDVFNLEGQTILVGGDMRPSSPEFAEAFAAGARRRGADIQLMDLISTDELYYASGKYNAPGVTFTASHNPAGYNGIKMSQAGAAPISSETGLKDIQAKAQEYLNQASGPLYPEDKSSKNPIPAASKEGKTESKDILPGYAQFLRSLVDLSKIRPLKVVVDAGNGIGGLTTPAVLGTDILESLPLEIIPLYFELDGSFPNHPANPLEPENLKDLQKAVVEQHADIGLAFDGDADRCFVVDEKGQPVSPSAVTALVAEHEIKKAQAEGNEEPRIIHNLITSAAVPELIEKNGGKPVESRVGHSFIKALMAKENAVFGGEHSAHYYFKDFYNADTGMLAAMHVLRALGNQKDPLSTLMASYDPYFSSGEINSEIADPSAAVQKVKEIFPSSDSIIIEESDGTTFKDAQGTWWFNLRPSNTEPFLRLNLEAHSPEKMEELRDQVLKTINN